MINITPPCSILFDQNVYIGNVPIGHTCYNKGNYIYGHLFICEECKQKIEQGESSRMTFPEIDMVELWKELARSIANSWLTVDKDTSEDFGEELGMGIKR